MKEKSKILSYIAIFASVSSIVASLSLIDLKKLLTIDWNILGWVSLAVSIFAVLSVVLTTYLMMRQHRILNIYLSYPASNKAETIKLKEALKDENVLSVDSLEPGSSIKDIDDLINKSHFCFYASGKIMSPIQKQELKEMRLRGKKVYVVSLDEEGRVPHALIEDVPLNINDSKFNEKLENVILSYK